MPKAGGGTIGDGVRAGAVTGGTGPRLIIHDESYNNGFLGGFVNVEGLAPIAKRHTAH